MSFPTIFPTKHLRRGDVLPPWNGKLRVYSMRLCPYAQRTLLALNAKKLDYEVVNIDLRDKPEWLTSKCAFGKVPALEIEDGVSIYESLITVECIEDLYPQIPLFPKDPVRKALDKIIVEASVPIQSLYLKLKRAPSTIDDDTIDAYRQALDFIQEKLQQRKTKFLHGNAPGYVDYMLWPWFERILTFEDDLVKIDDSKYSLLLDYIENMFKDPVVNSLVLPKEVLKKLHREYPAGLFRTQSIDE